MQAIFVDASDAVWMATDAGVLFYDGARLGRLDIEGLRAEQLDDNQACGFRPIRGLLRLARRRGLSSQCLDLRNSGDTAGRRDRVVGYGAFIFAG